MDVRIRRVSVGNYTNSQLIPTVDFAMGYPEAWLHSKDKLLWLDNNTIMQSDKYTSSRYYVAVEEDLPAYLSLCVEAYEQVGILGVRGWLRSAGVRYLLVE